MLFGKIFQIVKLISPLLQSYSPFSFCPLWPPLFPQASQRTGHMFCFCFLACHYSSPHSHQPLSVFTLPNSAQQCQKYHLHWYIFPWRPGLILACSNFWDVNPLQFFLNPSRGNAIHIQKECHSLLHHAGQVPSRSLSLGLISLLSSALYIDLLAWSSLLDA